MNYALKGTIKITYYLIIFIGVCHNDAFRDINYLTKNIFKACQFFLALTTNAFFPLKLFKNILYNEVIKNTLS